MLALTRPLVGLNVASVLRLLDAQPVSGRYRATEWAVAEATR